MALQIRISPLSQWFYGLRASMCVAVVVAVVMVVGTAYAQQAADGATPTGYSTVNAPPSTAMPESVASAPNPNTAPASTSLPEAPGNAQPLPQPVATPAEKQRPTDLSLEAQIQAELDANAAAAGIKIPANPAATTASAPASTMVRPVIGIDPISSDAIAPPPLAAMTPSPEQVAAQAEREALQAQAAAEAAKTKREEEHNRKSFERAEGGLFPLTGEQIRSLMQKVEDTQAASVAPAAGPPKGEVRIVNLALDPGAAPPQINLVSNYVTTIDILDSTGAPWPILDVGIGGSFEVSPTQAGSHVVRIMPLTRFGNGNLSLLLKDLPTPVIFRLAAGGPTVDLRYEVRVPKFGPNAKVPLVNYPQKLTAGDDTIMSILQNNPPSSAKRMRISGLDPRTMAWSSGIHVYVRTPLTLLSPAWNASVASADGTTVYEIGDAPVLLLSDNGAVVRAKLLRDDTP